MTDRPTTVKVRMDALQPGDLVVSGDDVYTVVSPMYLDATAAGTGTVVDVRRAGDPRILAVLLVGSPDQEFDVVANPPTGDAR